MNSRTPHEGVDDLVVLGGGQTPGVEQLVGRGEAVDAQALVGADAVHHHVQRAGGGDLGVLLAQRSGGRVARVGEGLVVGGDQPGVQLLEAFHGEEDLAADLDERGDVLALQAVRDLGDRPDVGGDVLAGAAVAAGGRPGQAAVLVGEVDGEAVDLELAQEVVVGGADVLGDPVGPGGQLLVVEGVVEGEHAFAVDHGGELRAVGPGDLLGRGVRGAQRRVLLLQCLQGAQLPVELAVADDRLVLHVVAEAVLLDLLGQQRVLLPHVRRNRALLLHPLFARHRPVLLCTRRPRHSGLSASDLAARALWASAVRA